jgi:SAM-dependent methyltransferase
MEAYTGFAEVYDTFMDNVPYAKWSAWIQTILRQHGIADGLVLDLGCGTGSMTELLAGAGYDMIGIDNSEEMLDLAMKKREQTGADILYLLQDMREFELYGTVHAIVSACDSVNYILEEEELAEVFRLANNYLDPQGIFVFDFNTRYKYEQLLGDTTIAENREACSFIWDNYYDPEDEINEYDLTLFVQEEEGLFRKFEETHFQRAYELDTIREILTEAGMVFECAYDAYTMDAPTETSERICVIARECGKTGKEI